MSITLLCLVKGNTTANAFAVDIDSGKLVSHLKDAIKAKKQNDFAGVDADKLKLWKVQIPGDHDDQLRKLILQARRTYPCYCKLPRKCLVQSVQSALTANFSSFALAILTRFRFQFSAWKRRCRVFRHL
jgi:hypothetical protein